MRFAGVFLAAISCRLPLNGLQMVRKRLLGTEREDQSPVLCGRGFITGWQFMPTENGPGCRRPVGESACLWAEGRGRKAMEICQRHFSSVHPRLLPVQKKKSLGNGVLREGFGIERQLVFVCLFFPQNGLDSAAVSPCLSLSSLCHSVIECAYLLNLKTQRAKHLVSILTILTHMVQ